jgi:phospholipase D1/2
VTEQLYIHAKVIIVDDRIALIGSANINERSMLGVRDSECAAVVRDTDMLWSIMDGEPYLVGRFAHTLRMRLMREHLGLDVDEVMEEERRVELDREEDEYESRMNGIYNGNDSETDMAKAKNAPSIPPPDQALRIANHERLRSFNHDVDWEEEDNPNLATQSYKPVTTDKRVIGNKVHAAEVDGEGPDQLKAAEKTGVARGRDSVLADGGREVLVTDIASEGKGTISHPNKPHDRPPPVHHRGSDESSSAGNDKVPPMPSLPRRTTEQLGLSQLSQLPALPLTDDTDIGGPPVHLDAAGKPAAKEFNPISADIKVAHVDKDCMRDPLNDSFFEDTWRQIAENNTKIFRRVFRCNPDSEVTNWHEYNEFIAYAERLAQSQGGKSTEREEQEAAGRSGPPGASSTAAGMAAVPGLSSLAEKMNGHGQDDRHLKTVAELAEDAREDNARRSDTGRERVMNGHLDGIDEKAELRGADEPASPVLPAGDEAFPSLESTLLSTSTAGAETAPQPATSTPAARKTTFSSTTPTITPPPTVPRTKARASDVAVAPPKINSRVVMTSCLGKMLKSCSVSCKDTLSSFHMIGSSRKSLIPIGFTRWTKWHLYRSSEFRNC